MKMRPLGNSGIDASVIGFGAWAIGGWMWGGTSESEAIRAIHAALDAGINLIDTAPIYGFGSSEEIVGKALRDRRDRAVIATKCGMVANTKLGAAKFRSTALGSSEFGHIDVRIYNHPDSIREEVDLSLKRLQTDRIDLYQTHWQDPTTPVDDTMDALLSLKQAGKIRAIGVCNASVEQMRQYASRGPLDTDQERYSMLDRKLEADQLPYCREHNIAMLAYSPLAMGMLTGKMGPDREFPAGDIRGKQPRFSKDNRTNVAAMLAEIVPTAARNRLSLTQLVIAWTFMQPGVTHVLCGARTPAQSTENAAAGSAAISLADLQTISEVVTRQGNAIV
jgi:aryl-alcohol dehydrogenase-like predicted oxidoreductase